jgi:hypothetical protein
MSYLTESTDLLLVRLWAGVFAEKPAIDGLLDHPV